MKKLSNSCEHYSKKIWGHDLRMFVTKNEKKYYWLESFQKPRYNALGDGNPELLFFNSKLTHLDVDTQHNGAPF